MIQIGFHNAAELLFQNQLIKNEFPKIGWLTVIISDFLTLALHCGVNQGSFAFAFAGVAVKREKPKSSVINFAIIFIKK